MGVSRVVTGLIGIFVALPTFAAFPAAATNPEGEKGARRIDIDNFGRVNANYYRGEQPDRRDYAALASMGIRTIIDLQLEAEEHAQRLTERAGMKYVRIPMVASEDPSDEAIAQFLALVNDPANAPVYVHCKAGKHRTGVMSAVYRMTQDGWTADQAYAEMKSYKFKVPLNFLFGYPGLKDFVYEYYQTLR